MALTYFNLSQKELESKCRERQLKTSANNKEELRQRLINHDNASKDDQHPAKRQRSQEPDIRSKHRKIHITISETDRWIAMLRIPLQPISKNIDTNLAETSNKRPAGLSTLDSYVASAVATISPTISAISTPGISTTPFVPATPVIPVAPAVPATPLHRCKATTPLHRCKATARNADQDNTLSTGPRLSTPHDYTVSSTSDASVPPTTHATPSYGGQATAHETLPLSKVTPSKALNARGFGLFSVLGSIDLAQDRPEGLSTFEWCAKLYFDALWEGPRLL